MQTMSTDPWHQVPINIYSLLNALYAISAVLISFGAVIGKITPFQLIVMTVVELILHAINFKVLMDGCLHLTDMGGTYVDHMFGAYFGLAVAFMLGKPEAEPEMGNTPDVFSLMVPSFCGSTGRHLLRVLQWLIQINKVGLLSTPSCPLVRARSRRFWRRHCSPRIGIFALSTSRMPPWLVEWRSVAQPILPAPLMRSWLELRPGWYRVWGIISRPTTPPRKVPPA